MDQHTLSERDICVGGIAPSSRAGRAGDLDPNGALADRIQRAFQSLAPRDVCIAVAPIGPSYEITESERALIAAAAAPRQLEFAAGRWCAHQALVLAGGPLAAIGRGALREPLWPANFAGSITHDNRFAAAAACPLHPGERPSVGIDLIDTTDFATFSSISTRVLSAADRAALGARELGGLDVAQAFAAKETAVKVVSVRAGRFIDFSEISLRPTPSGSGHVMTHAALPAPLYSRNLIVEGVLLTVATARSESP